MARRSGKSTDVKMEGVGIEPPLPVSVNIISRHELSAKSGDNGGIVRKRLPRKVFRGGLKRS